MVALTAVVPWVMPSSRFQQIASSDGSDIQLTIGAAELTSLIQPQPSPLTAVKAANSAIEPPPTTTAGAATMPAPVAPSQLAADGAWCSQSGTRKASADDGRRLDRDRGGRDHGGQAEGAQPAARPGRDDERGRHQPDHQQVVVAAADPEHEHQRVGQPDPDRELGPSAGAFGQDRQRPGQQHEAGDREQPQHHRP